MYQPNYNGNMTDLFSSVGPINPQDLIFGPAGSSVPGYGLSPHPSLSTSNIVNNVPSLGIGGPSTTGLGFNMPTAQLAMSGLQTLGGLWSAFQAANLAKKQFNFTKDITETNLANQIKSYNTSISDRARSRGFVEGQSPAQTQAYIDQNSLSRRG